MVALFVGLGVALVALVSLVSVQRRRGSGNKGVHPAPWPGVHGHPDNFG